METPDDDDGTRTIVQPQRASRDDDVDRHTREFEALSLTTTGLNIRYHDGGEIGRGGSASIRQVYDRNMLRWNAVKRLDKAFAKDPTRALSFLEEARLTGQLEHPCIVPVHEVGTAEDGAPFFSMKLVRGQSLEAMIERLGADRLAPEHLDGLLRVLVKVCEAVGYAHSRGVVHRDLKPENVMVGDFGQVYVMDWGIAHVMPKPADGERAIEWVELPSGRRTPKGVVGTPVYMPPEQTKGDPALIDARTDVFALGGLLYHILTGRPPHEPGPPMRVLVAAHRCEIAHPMTLCDDPRLPPGLAAVAMKALAPDPDARFPDALAMSESLEAFARGAWHLPRRHVPAGQRVVTEGDAGDEAFIIVAGRLVVFREGGGRPEVLARLGPGDVFGEMAVFTQQPRSASVAAETDADLLVVRGDTLSDAVGLNSWVGAFVRALANRLVAATKG